MSVDWDEVWKRDLGNVLSLGPSTRSRQRVMRTLLRRYGRAGGSLLDVGCGTGALLREAESLGRFGALKGVDVSEAALGEARVNCPTARYELTDVCTTPLAERFDLITCMMTLDLVEDERAAAAHLAEMLLEGGHLIVVVQHLGRYRTELDDRYGVRRHDLGSLTALCAPFDLEPVRVFSWGWPLYALYYRAMSDSGAGMVGMPSRRPRLLRIASSLLTAAFAVDDLFTWSGRGRVLFAVFRKRGEPGGSAARG
jgi:SAM-dependent methyltransferase